ncbi:WYL domain-containing protein [Fictibacillus gelatini]|uniref:WYL domain-containing protein n=1 Tax=Fictibacillus gelatini TaxID=225985 RepID=UPI00047921F6|nr:WYL domain-containing protein [Fictibacillus gelatini]
MNLFNAMYDRFGLDADIRKVDDEHFRIKTNATISEGLVGWIFSWGRQAKVLKPDYLVEKV